MKLNCHLPIWVSFSGGEGGKPILFCLQNIKRICNMGKMNHKKLFALPVPLFLPGVTHAPCSLLHALCVCAHNPGAPRKQRPATPAAPAARRSGSGATGMARGCAVRSSRERWCEDPRKGSLEHHAILRGYPQHRPCKPL